MNRLIKASDYNIRYQARSVRHRISLLSGKLYRRGMLETPFRDEPAAGQPVFAHVDHGQWIARCDDCGGPEAVDYDEPIFYCFSCGNRAVGGRPRSVIFPEPELREEIERLLLARPVDDSVGTNEIDRAFSAKPQAIGTVAGELVMLVRSWKLSETVDDLRSQNLFIEELVQQEESRKRGQG